MKLHYFGTDLRQAGHYFFDVYKESIANSNIRDEKLPFRTEQLPYPRIEESGQVGKYHAFGFTIFAISGSVADRRGGCKSVFFVEQIIPFDKLESLIRSTEFGKTVLERLIPQSPTPSNQTT